MTNPLEQIRELTGDWCKAADAHAELGDHFAAEVGRTCAAELQSILDASQGYVCVPVEPKKERTVWFMYDCHLFAKPDMSSEESAFSSVRKLFDEDGCGSIFVRQWKDGPTIKDLCLSADYKVNGYKVTDEEIRAWVQLYFAASKETNRE